MGCSLGTFHSPELISQLPEKSVEAKESDSPRVPQKYTAKILCILCADDSRLFTGGEDGLVLEWDLHAFSPAVTFSGHSDAVLCLAVDPKIGALFSGSRDASICHWDISAANTHTTSQWPSLGRRSEKRKLLGHTYEVSALCVAEARYLYSGSTNHLVQEWDVTTGQRLRSIICGSEDKDPVRSISVVGQYLFVASFRGSVWQLNLLDGDSVNRYKVGSRMVNVMVVKFGRLFIATGSGKVLDFDVESGQLNREMEVSESAITSLCVGKGSMFVSTSNNEIYEISIANEKRVRKMKTRDLSVLCLGLSTHSLYSGGGAHLGQIHEWSLDKRDMEEPVRVHCPVEKDGKMDLFAKFVGKELISRVGP